MTRMVGKKEDKENVRKTRWNEGDLHKVAITSVFCSASLGFFTPNYN